MLESFPGTLLFWSQALSCVYFLHFANATPDLFRPDSPITKDQAYLSLNHFCVINNSQLRIESGCHSRCQVD